MIKIWKSGVLSQEDTKPSAKSLPLEDDESEEVFRKERIIIDNELYKKVKYHYI
jgi:hypothetical protein